MRRPALALALAALAAPLAAQQTRPERTGGRETSSHADVRAFLDTLQLRGADVRVGTLGHSPEGRVIPFVVAARPMVHSPAAAKASGKPVVWLQGNIHSGEVEGKEAAQMLLRDLTLGPARALLDSVIVLVVPIYNADGNEQLGPGARNRPGQNGPERVGPSLNGQGLNLNRDYVKAEAPETRGALALLAAWDPDVFIDLHTTNGSYHGYALTWSPGLNPNDTPANAWVRETFLPEVRRRLQRRHRLETFPYGNFRSQHPDSLALGWETYDARPRFGTNWAGLRGKLAILSEGYSNDPFPRRIEATYRFVREILSLLAEERARVRTLVQEAAAARPDSVAVRARLAPPRMEAVIAELTVEDGDGAGPFARRRRTGEFRTIRMPVFDRFEAARREARPWGYLLPPALGEVARLLARQGITVERLRDGWQGEAERFAVDSIVAEPYVFEGHRTVRVEGRWQAAAPHAAPAGAFLVRTDQPLGTFAAYLLEPASEDGIVTWNLADRLLSRRAPFPVARVRAPVRAATEELAPPGPM
jgi:hypothetical protein